MADPEKPTIVRFGEFEFDSTRGVLCRGGVVLKLQPQPFRVLQILLDRAPRIVTREELGEYIWGSEVHVDLEQSINFCVRQIRSILNDSASSPRFIDTLPKQGYRFIAEVVRNGSPAAEVATPIEEVRVDIPITELKPAVEDRRAGPTRRNLVLLGGAALLGGGGMWWMGRFFRGTARERAINVVLPLPAGTAAADPGHTLGPPVVAPDGTAVIVSLNTTEGSYLFMRRLDADHLVRMEGTRGGGQPFWSPDSLHVGFFADAKLKRMPVAGGSAITLCEASGPRGASWGSGGVILFGLNYRGIYQVPETGGAAALTTQLDAAAGENSHRNPVFLPDGLRFLYLARTDDPEKSALYKDSLKPASGRQRIGVADGEFALGRDPESDSWYLLSQQAGKIVMQAFDVRRGKLTGTSHVLLDREGTISCSDTGVLVIRTDQQMLTRLLWLDRDGRRLGVVGDAGDYWSVGISPDDKSLSTVRHNYLTGQFRVWTASCARGLLEPMSDSNHAIIAGWSSDSSTVYYTDTRRRKLIGHKISYSAPEEVVMNLEGRREILVEDVSPDGHIVIGELITDGAHSEIGWSVKKESPEWHSVGASGPLGLHAKLSHDGKWLAFASFETGRSEIYLIQFPEGLQRQRVSNDGGRMPYWRRDGKELFYVASDGGMMSVDLAAGNALQAAAPKKLFQSNFRQGSDRLLYGVSGDGQRFLEIDDESTARESDIEVVLHWPSLLVRTA